MKKILIIEDDAVLGDVLLQKLQTAGYEPELVRDGAKGYERIGEWMPDLVLLDVFLPIINGIELLHQKKANPAIAHVPVIALSNSLNPISIPDVQEMGVVEFIVKSDITAQGIVEKVRKVLGDETPQTTISHAISQEPIMPSSSVDFTLLEGKKILLVEDDSFLSSILSTRLRNKNVNVINAATGEDALVEVKKHKPDMVLLDVLLPGITGFEVLETIRKDADVQNTKVIILSNFSQAEDQKRAVSLGADFLVKALVDPDTILAKVVEGLEK